jgi:hypothetical protein
MIPYVGSCGETTERAAARAHKAITFFYTLAVVGEVGVVVIKVLMILWHRNSDETHRLRAIARGEP